MGKCWFLRIRWEIGDLHLLIFAGGLLDNMQFLKSSIGCKDDRYPDHLLFCDPYNSIPSDCANAV